MQTSGKPFILIVASLLLSMSVAQGAAAQETGRSDADLRVQEPGALVVLSGTASEALLLDPLSNRVLARFPTGPDPQDVALSPDGRFAYVTSYGWEPSATASPAAGGGGAASLGAPTNARGVTVLDLVRREVHAVFQPGEYRRLGGIAVGEGGTDSG